MLHGVVRSPGDVGNTPTSGSTLDARAHCLSGAILRSNRLKVGHVGIGEYGWGATARAQTARRRPQHLIQSARALRFE